MSIHDPAPPSEIETSEVEMRQRRFIREATDVPNVALIFKFNFLRVLSSQFDVLGIKVFVTLRDFVIDTTILRAHDGQSHRSFGDSNCEMFAVCVQSPHFVRTDRKNAAPAQDAEAI